MAVQRNCSCSSLQADNKQEREVLNWAVAQSTAALPWTTIVNILVIWALIAIPLCVLGYIAAFNTRADLSAPCRTSRYPRHIPGLPWYQKLMPQMAIAGFLPFCAIYNELYYALPSWWGWKVMPWRFRWNPCATHVDLPRDALHCWGYAAACTS